jgi:hypothetical protein
VNSKLEKTMPGFGVTELRKSATIGAGTCGVALAVGVSDATGVSVMVGLSVMVGDNVIEGTNVIAGTRDGVGEGGKY